MLPLLRERFPDSKITLLLRKYAAGLIEGNPYVDEIMLYDDGEQEIPFPRMLKSVREGSFDIAIVVRPIPRLAWLMFRAGIPLRIGTGYRYYSLLFNERVYEHRKDARRHEVEYNLNLLKPVGCFLKGEPQFMLTVPPEVETRVDALFDSMSLEKGKEIVILHPGTGGSAKEWPPESFGRLAARLQSERGSRILVTGTRGEEEKISRVVHLSGGKAVSLAGMLTLKELGAVIRRADLFVSNSTGPLHLAVAVGTPVVAMFPQIAPMSAGRWGPYTARKKVLVPDRPPDCRKCAGRNDDQCECMRSITVDAVYDAAGSLLAWKTESVPHV